MIVRKEKKKITGAFILIKCTTLLIKWFPSDFHLESNVNFNPFLENHYVQLGTINLFLHIIYIPILLSTIEYEMKFKQVGENYL